MRSFAIDEPRSSARALYVTLDMFPPFRYNIDCDRQADYLQMNKFLYPEKEGKYNIPCCSALLVNVAWLTLVTTLIGPMKETRDDRKSVKLVKTLHRQL